MRAVRDQCETARLEWIPQLIRPSGPLTLEKKLLALRNVFQLKIHQNWQVPIKRMGLPNQHFTKRICLKNILARCHPYYTGFGKD